VCQRRTTGKYLHSQAASKGTAATTTENKLHLYTHTQKRVFPPISITITKRGMLRFQPQERI